MTTLGTVSTGTVIIPFLGVPEKNIEHVPLEIEKINLKIYRFFKKHFENLVLCRCYSMAQSIVFLILCHICVIVVRTILFANPTQIQNVSSNFNWYTHGRAVRYSIVVAVAYIT